MAHFPSAELMNRVGYIGDGPDLPQRYQAAGGDLFELLVEYAGEHLDLDHARVLDFGCGAGRVLRHWADRVERGAQVTGVDIDEPSVAWCGEHLRHVGAVHTCGARPPLDLPDAAFDLVYAFSVFTHLDTYWADWLAELHRVLRPGGLALISFLGPEKMRPILGIEPDGREGMVIWGTGRNWDVGGPVIFHDRWWIKQRWGRGFDLLRLDEAPTGEALGAGQSIVLMRAKDVPVTPDLFRRIDPDSAAEAEALRRADEIRDVAGPRAFDAEHHLADLVRETVRAQEPALVGVGLDISSRDDMYLAHLAAETSASRAITSYFAVGLEVLGVIDEVVRWHFGGWDRVPSLLDMGSGYGRVGRFLVHRISALQLTVADIQAEAVAFQSQVFGATPMVTTAESVPAPEGARYGLITVVSLFTHLPKHRFVPWLRQLWGLVAPGGALLLSTHNSDPAPAGVDLDEDGFGYLTRSEIPVLDVADYGTTYTTDRYVRAAIEEACRGDEPASVQRMPRAFGNIQDVYVLSRAGGSGAAGPLTANRVVHRGHLDQVVPTADGVRLEGWAADPTGSRATPVELRVRLDGEEVPVRSGLKRSDVADYYGRPWDLDLVFSGWHAECRAPAGARLLIEATGPFGTSVLHDGPMPTTG